MRIKTVFTVPEKCYASADLYDREGKFIRNLWNQRLLYSDKTYTEYYRDDSGLIAGDDYRLKLTINNIRSYWANVIGNTAAKLTGASTFFNMMQAQDMDAGVDSFFYCTAYNEGKTSCFRMLKSNIQAATKVFSDRGFDTYHVCVKNGIVYWAGVDAYKTKSWAEEYADRWIDKKQTAKEAANGFPDYTEDMVRKCNLTYCDADGYFLGYRKPTTTKQDFIKWFDTYIVRDTWCKTCSGVFATMESNNSEVRFLYGKEYKPYLGRTYASVIGLYQGDLADVTGLAVSDDCIFIAYGGRQNMWYWNSRNVITVLDLFGKELNQFKVEKPGKMIVVDDFLFYCSGQKICKAKIDAAGNITPEKELQVNGSFTVFDVSYYKPTDTIAVAATDGLIHYYDKEFNLKSEQGNKEMYWEKPDVHDDKFYWEDMRRTYECFICTDTVNGLQLIGDGGNQRVQVFDRNFIFKTSISWLSTSYQVESINDDATRVFSEYLEFNVDYTNPQSLKWRLANNWSCYADSEYIYLNMPFVLNGKTYAKQQSISFNQIRLVELSPEVGLVPLNVVKLPSNIHKSNVMIYPDGGIYRNENKPGYYIRVGRQKLLNVNEDGTFNWAAPVVIVNTGTPPPESTQNNMSRRVFETIGDKLYQYNAHRTGTGNHLTAINMLDGTFIHNAFPSTHAGYFGEYMNDVFDIGNGVIYPGGIFIARDAFLICNYHGEFWGAGQVNKWHLFDQHLVALHTYGTEVKTTRKQGIEHPAAMMAGNSFTGNFVKQGEFYYLFHCDENHHSGIHVVRFEGMNTVKRLEYPSSVFEYNDSPWVTYPMLELPKVGNLKNGDAGWSMEPEEGYYISSTDSYQVRMGRKFLSKTEPSDLQLSFRVPNRTAMVTYPINPVSVTKWNFECFINFEDNYHSRDNGTTSGIKLQLVDADDKVLFELFPALNYSTKIVTLYINDKVVFSLREFDAEKILDYYRKIIVWASNNILYARFHNYPTITLGRIETKPALIRLIAYNFISKTYDQNLSVRSIKFNRR